MRAKSILVVEDDVDVRRALATALGGDGCRVHEAEGAAVALESLRGGATIDVIVLGVKASMEYGGMFRAEQRNDPRFAAIPVVALAAAPNADVAALDADAIVPAPFESVALRNSIDDAVVHAAVRRSEEAARASAERVRAVLSAVNSSLFEYDARGTLLAMWPDVDALTGQSAADVCMQSVRTQFVGDAGALLGDAIERVAASGARETVEFSLEVASRRHSCVAELASTSGPANSVPRVVMARTDVTERRLMHERSHISERLASLGTLAAGIAHEINNPLAYISANVAFVLGELDRLEQQASAARDPKAARAVCESMAARTTPLAEALRDAQDGCSRVQRIVRDLKTFSRNKDDSREPVDVHSVLDGAIAVAQKLIRTRARLVREYGTVPLLYASSGKLAQLFLNLLDNAAHSIQAGASEANEIRVTTHSDAAGRVCVAITDTGGGIADENLSRVFDPFFSTKAQGHGTGLGLSICHGIVAGLGGEITVESSLGHGTTFRVALPVAPPREARPSAPPPRTPTSAERRRRVLVIDDDAAVATATRRLLSREFDVEVATGGDDGIAHLERDDRFDVILCDMMMPGRTGIDVYAHIKGHWPALAARVTFMTGGSYTDSAEAFLGSVENSRLEKPFTLDEFKHATT